MNFGRRNLLIGAAALTAGSIAAYLITAANLRRGNSDAVETDGGEAAPSASPYLGAVATRGQQNNQFMANTFGTWAMSKSMHYARDEIAALTLVYGNFYVPNNTNVETDVGVGTIKVAIEYPVGVITPCNEGEIAFPNGLTLLTCSVAIPDRAQFWVRCLQKNAEGIPYVEAPSADGVGYDPSEGFIGGAGEAVDMVDSGTIPATTGPTLPPLVIAATTRRASVAIHGDSRSFGGGERLSDASGDYGDAARSIGPVLAYTKFATNGSRLEHYLSSRTYRSQAMAYFSHILNQYGFNDRAYGRTAEQVAADRAKFAAAYPNATVIGTTLYNSTTTTDNWATLTNQTINVNDPAGLNALIRSGIAGEQTYFDVNRGLDPENFGKFPVNDLPFYSTQDGIHLNTLGSEIIRTSGVINTALIVRQPKLPPSANAG